MTKRLLTWNITTQMVECGDLSFQPTGEQRRVLSCLTLMPGKPILHRQLISWLGKELNARPIDDFLKTFKARCTATFGRGTVGVVNHRGEITWRGLVKRVSHMVQGSPIRHRDGTPATLAEVEKWLAETYGQVRCAEARSATHQVALLRSDIGAFHILAEQPGGQVLVVVAGEGWSEATSS